MDARGVQYILGVKQGWPEPYINTVYDRMFGISCPKMPYIHRIYMVLANPRYECVEVSLPVYLSVSGRTLAAAAGLAGG
jgi:hypothetical protein